MSHLLHIGLSHHACLRCRPIVVRGVASPIAMGRPTNQSHPYGFVVEGGEETVREEGVGVLTHVHH